MKHLNIHIDQYEQNGECILGNIHTIINQTDRIALIWPNGIGKSTFMKILQGTIHDYHGYRENIGNMTLGYLEQIHFTSTDITVREELKNAFHTIRTLERQIADEETRMENDPNYTHYDHYTSLLEQFNTFGGYTYENDVERVARGIGIFHLLENTLAEVSWWERTKIALAKILLSRPDFLLLDEPTNFIDLPSVEWLEKYLIDTWKGGYLIISHDREFLDETCDSVIDMLGKYGIEEYAWSYSYAIQEKTRKQERDLKAYDEQQVMIASEKTLINRFRAGSRASFAKSRERALEKIDILEKPTHTKEIRFQFPFDKHGPETLIRIEDAFIGRHEPLFFIRHATLNRGERIGIVWENGVGKSTLLKTIMRQIRVLEGFLQVHENARILYFSQMHETLDPEKTIADNFPLHGLSYTHERVGGIIEQYGFQYMDFSKKVGLLSGGERSRLLFALLAENATAWKPAHEGGIYEHSENSHLLILDEPTNHLDTSTREMLEKALIAYGGAILFISHDRYFVNKLAEKLWIIEDGELVISYGNYEDYQFKKERWLDLDMTLFDIDGEMDIVLEEKLGATEARRIKEKFARKKSGRKR